MGCGFESALSSSLLRGVVFLVVLLVDEAILVAYLLGYDLGLDIGAILAPVLGRGTACVLSALGVVDVHPSVMSLYVSRSASTAPIASVTS